MLYLDYVTYKKLGKLIERDLRGNTSNNINNQFNESLDYYIWTTESDINNDITSNWKILNDLEENLKNLVLVYGKTVYQVS